MSESWFKTVGIWEIFISLSLQSRINQVPSKGHISTPIFRKTVVVLSKICLGSPPSKFLEVCINSEYMWYWSPVYIFNCALKSYFPPVSKLQPLCQTPTHRRIYLCKSFHSDMPNFDTVLLNKQYWCISKYDIWVRYFNTKLHRDRWKQKKPFTFWYCVDNFYPWKDIVDVEVKVHCRT